MGFRIYKFMFTVFVFIFISGVLNAMNWPSDDAVLIRNFGANDGGKPVLGMVFSGNNEDTKILAAERGEIIFSHSINNRVNTSTNISITNDNVTRLPSPLGAWTAIDHGDGLISIYSRYADSTGYPLSEISIERQEPVASAGISGWSEQNGFYFIVFDRRERRWINPAIIITPQQETGIPQIISVELRNDQGLIVQSRNITQGRYTIFVNAAGTSRTTSGQGTFAPQRIICLVNGAEAGSLAFEAVSARDGVLMVYRNGLVPARQIYENFPAFETAEVFLNRGQATLEVIVQDIAGNTRSVINRLAVN